MSACLTQRPTPIPYAQLPDFAEGEKASEINQAVTPFPALTPPIAPNEYLGCP